MAVSINTQLVADRSQEEKAKYRNNLELSILLKSKLICFRTIETICHSLVSKFKTATYYFEEKFAIERIIFAVIVSTERHGVDRKGG